MHYQRIAHRDIKPANLLLGEDRVQVADLGACGELAAAGRVSGTVGTPAFRAPEAAAPADKYSGEVRHNQPYRLSVVSIAYITLQDFLQRSSNLPRFLASYYIYNLLYILPNSICLHFLHSG